MINTEFSLSEQASLWVDVDAELAMLSPDELADELKSVEFSFSGSGTFPKNITRASATKKPLRPSAARLLAILYLGHQDNVAVLGNLYRELRLATDQEGREQVQTRITKLEANNRYAQRLAQSVASGTELHEWRRVPGELKRAFTLIGFASHRDAYAITIRLDSGVAGAALTAAKGQADYLSAILRRLGVTELAFVLERSDRESSENSPWHLHCSAIISADLLEELTREPIGADGKPKPSKLRKALALDYRQRYKNRAVDVQPLRTAGAWGVYITKDIDVTTHRLKGRSPCYASQSAKRAARELYDGMRRWLTTTC
ncbi:hypothetical protein SAMN05216201_10776 [Pseudomonas linyingensis]|uniref:Uncharacterized protein n=1 Tax=Pseudomonas linyingensis TaxID=915471 RepID=A0A1H6Y7Z7_9PSED|nr:hypothetical protein [Pseudomonas linyingensis]SEJ33250.1 hypothetical protein SAMN05216201_10776 [Pseudomonas linyingensis]